jgi:hypothetical protein
MKNKVQQYIDLVNTALEKAERLESNLPTAGLDIARHMSGKRGNHFLNNLIFEGCNYLEVGCYHGSTLCSALYKNKPNKSFSIELNTKGELIENIKKYVTCDHKHITSDCFDINLKENGVENIDVYFYDADHRTQDQYDALVYYINSLSDVFVFIVDDWNGTGDYDVSGGTYNAIKDLNLTIHLDASKHDNSNSEGYHNGFGIFVLEKNK